MITIWLCRLRRRCVVIVTDLARRCSPDAIFSGCVGRNRVRFADRDDEAVDNDIKSLQAELAAGGRR